MGRLGAALAGGLFFLGGIPVPGPFIERSFGQPSEEGLFHHKFRDCKTSPEVRLFLYA